MVEYLRIFAHIFRDWHDKGFLNLQWQVELCERLAVSEQNLATLLEAYGWPAVTEMGKPAVMFDDVSDGFQVFPGVSRCFQLQSIRNMATPWPHHGGTAWLGLGWCGSNALLQGLAI